MVKYSWRLLILLLVWISPAYCKLEIYNGLQDEAGSGSGHEYPDVPEPVFYNMPNGVGDVPETSTEASVPEVTTTTTTTTPSTPSTTRNPLAFEKYTSGLIQSSNNTMDQLQMDLLKYETQLNLNALDTLVPVLEEIRRNMSKLLLSSSQDHESFKEQSLALDNELTEIENQIKKNRELQEHYEAIQWNTREQLGMVYNSLGNLLNSQVYILGFKQHLKTSKPKSASEIQLFIDHTLTFTAKRSSNATAYAEVYQYLKKLQDPSNRLTGYSYFLSSTKKNNTSEGVTLEFVRDVFTFPELVDLRDQVPPMLGLIFSERPKGMRATSNGKQLNVGSGSALELATSGEDGMKRWMFHPQEGTEYFAIVDYRSNQALGLVTTRRAYYSDEVKSLGLLRYDETTQLNQRYHWKIVAVTVSGKTALNFVNRETFGLSSYALGTESGSVTISSYASYYSSQRWELF